MDIQSLVANPEILRLALLSIVAVFLLVGLVLHLRRRSRRAPQAGEAAALHPMPTGDSGARVPGLLLRGILLAAALAVAGGFLLVLLPEPAFEGILRLFAARAAPPQPAEKISFLYLGDAVLGSDLHIRGAIRNITATPVGSLDAAIRLYGHDRTLLETTVVRMDSEAIAPDAVATFHLTYPDYKGQFGSYSVDFKLRSGEPIYYKDVRNVRPRQ
jgi:hypothetical protein